MLHGRSRSLSALALTGLIALSGCAADKDGSGFADLTNSLFNDPEPTAAGGGDLYHKKSNNENVDLALLILPNMSKDFKKEIEDLDATDQLSRVIPEFYETYKDPAIQAIQRNRIQERLLWESARICSEFKKIMHDARTNVNFWTGAASTVTGVLGAVFTPAATARALAGASGILSGVRAKANQEFYQNLATQVIIEGIDLRRAELYDTMVNKGQVNPIDRHAGGRDKAAAGRAVPAKARAHGRASEYSQSVRYRLGSTSDARQGWPVGAQRRWEATYRIGG
jgi:hypothetical protein